MPRSIRDMKYAHQQEENECPKTLRAEDRTPKDLATQDLKRSVPHRKNCTVRSGTHSMHVRLKETMNGMTTTAHSIGKWRIPSIEEISDCSTR